MEITQLDVKRRCPFVLVPDPDCYVNDLSSYKVAQIMKFCAGQFKECEIYKRLEAQCKEAQP